MRPTSSQIDHWTELGLEIDWDILFNSSKEGEHFILPSQNLLDVGASYNGSAHGFSGPLSTCVSPHIAMGDLHNIFNETMKNLGIPPRDEFNGGDLRGFGVQQVTQNSTIDIREDSAQAYYYPYTDRPNLVVMVNSTGLRIDWSAQDSSDGKAIGTAVEYRRADGTTAMVAANREIVISAGAIRSPGILERSGVGSSLLLSKHSIEVKVDLPAVGENFQDQPTMAIISVSSLNVTGFPAFVAHVSMHDLFGDETDAVYEATLKKLPQYAATIASQNGGASDAGAQERLMRGQLDLIYKSNTPTSEMVPIAISTTAGMVFWVHQPLSRGSVHLNISNPERPIIVPNLLQLDFDQQVNIATAKWARKFLDTQPFSSILNASTTTPNYTQDTSDEEWLDWIKTTSEPNYHHLGTTAMLPREMGGVVDNDFKVYGTANIRVVDLGVVPVQVAGHSTAPLYGIAEWASHKIIQSQ